MIYKSIDYIKKNNPWVDIWCCDSFTILINCNIWNFVNFTGVISTCFPDWLFFLLKIFLFPIPGINKKEAVAFFLGSGVVCGDFVKSACATYAHLAQ